MQSRPDHGSFNAAVTRNPPSSSWYPVVGAEQYWITIKPERLLEPLVERLAVGGRGLTLMVIHIPCYPSIELDLLAVHHPAALVCRPCSDAQLRTCCEMLSRQWVRQGTWSSAMLVQCPDDAVLVGGLQTSRTAQVSAHFNMVCAPLAARYCSDMPCGIILMVLYTSLLWYCSLLFGSV